MQYIKLEMGYLSMKANNKKLIKLLGTLDILESEEIKENNPKTEDDVTYTVSNVAGNESVEYRVLPDSVDDETVLFNHHHLQGDTLWLGKKNSI